MWDRYLNRLNLTAFVLFFYLLPVVFLSYSLALFSHEKRWLLFTVGLLISVAGALLLYFALKKWEQMAVFPAAFVSEVNRRPIAVEEIEAVDDLPEPDQRPLQLEKERIENELKLKEIELVEIKEESCKWEEKCEQLLCEFANFKQKVMDELEQKRILLDEYSQTIKDQRSILQKKQQQVAEFENKVHDLSYEVKTLLQLTEVTRQPTKQSMVIREATHLPQFDGEDEDEPTPFDKQIKTLAEAQAMLNRCIDNAQKITGVGHFSSGSRFRDLPIDSHALDLRRLYDTLRSENSCTLFLYSRKEDKILFINNQVKALLGWSPEKIIQQFPEMIKEGRSDWIEKVHQLNTAHEVLLSLTAKSRTGRDVKLKGLLGIIPTGLFRNNAIGVLYPAE